LGLKAIDLTIPTYFHFFLFYIELKRWDYERLEYVPENVFEQKMVMIFVIEILMNQMVVKKVKK
jgi:hypothetical protein